MAAEWLTISPLSGSGFADVKVTAAEHTGRNSREATLKFQIGEDVKELRKVVQAGHVSFVTIEPEKEISDNEEHVITGQSNLNKLRFNYSGELKIVKPTTYRVNGKEYAFDTVTDLGGDEGYNYEITIKIDEEISGKSKTGDIYISYDTGYASEKCTIKTPDNPYIKVSEGNIEFNSNGGTKTLLLESNTNWTIEQA